MALPVLNVTAREFSSHDFRQEQNKYNYSN